MPDHAASNAGKQRTEASVLWLSHFVPYPPHGGARIRSYYLLRELSREFDIDLVMLDLRRPGFPGKDPDAEQRALRELVRSVRRFPIEFSTSSAGKTWFFARSFFSRLPVTSLLFRRGRFIRAVRRAFSEAPYAAVHLDTVDLFPYASAISNTPMVLNHHNVESELLARQAEARREPLRPYFRSQARKLAALERRFCSQVAVNVTVSDRDADVLRTSCPAARFEVVPNGVDTEFHRPDPDRPARPAKTLVWAGFMHTFVNRDAIEFFLREIWPILVRARDDIRLLLIGECPPDLLATAQGRQRIEAPGYVPDVRPHLARGDVYIVPIRVGGGTRLKILDAFAAGIPLVSTSIGCEGLAGRDGQELLVADAPEDFASAVLRLLDDRELRLKLAHAARELVEREYAWKVVGRGLRDLYRGLCARSHG